MIDNMDDFSWDCIYIQDPIFWITYKKIVASRKVDGFKIQENGMLTFKTSTGEKVYIPANLL